MATVEGGREGKERGQISFKIMLSPLATILVPFVTSSLFTTKAAFDDQLVQDKEVFKGKTMFGSSYLEA